MAVPFARGARTPLPGSRYWIALQGIAALTLVAAACEGPYKRIRAKGTAWCPVGAIHRLLYSRTDEPTQTPAAPRLPQRFRRDGLRGRHLCAAHPDRARKIPVGVLPAPVVRLMSVFDASLRTLRADLEHFVNRLNRFWIPVWAEV